MNILRLFSPVAEDLFARAEAAETAGNTKDAFDLFRRAVTVYRIARFPINYDTGLRAEAWARGKEVYSRAGPYFSPRSVDPAQTCGGKSQSTFAFQPQPPPQARFPFSSSSVVWMVIAQTKQVSLRPISIVASRL
jgi:hypothetical protein